MLFRSIRTFGDAEKGVLRVKPEGCDHSESLHRLGHAVSAAVVVFVVKLGVVKGDKAVAVKGEYGYAIIDSDEEIKADFAVRTRYIR